MDSTDSSAFTKILIRAAYTDFRSGRICDSVEIVRARESFSITFANKSQWDLTEITSGASALVGESFPFFPGKFFN